MADCAGECGWFGPAPVDQHEQPEFHARQQCRARLVPRRQANHVPVGPQRQVGDFLYECRRLERGAGAQERDRPNRHPLQFPGRTPVELGQIGPARPVFRVGMVLPVEQIPRCFVNERSWNSGGIL